MKKKATRKDFYMEIRKSPGRFLSILFIVALGVAFFSGIRASEPDMRMTGDAYFDQSGLMDIKVLSTFGVTDDDVKAIKEVKGVADAEGAYSVDFLQQMENEQRVIHVMSLQKKMNQVKVSEGRLPKKAGECLADEDQGYKVGDTIKLKSGTTDPLTDTLTTDTYKVVGLCSSPCYISYGRGSTTIGTGNVDAFIVVPEESFDMDVYTEVYVQAAGAKKLITFTDEYEDAVEEVMDSIKDITGERASIRRQEIVDEAQDELEEARAELADGKAEAEKELSDGAAKIAKAEDTLTAGKEQIASGRKQIADAKTTLKDKQGDIDKARVQYLAGLSQLKDGTSAYLDGKKKFEAQKPGLLAQMKELETQKVGLTSQIGEDEKNLVILQENILNTENTLQVKYASLYAQAGELESKIQEAQMEKESLDTRIKEIVAEIERLQSQENVKPDDDIQKQIEALEEEKTELEKQCEDKQKQITDLQEEKTPLEQKIATIELPLTELRKQEAGLLMKLQYEKDTLSKIEGGYKAVSEGISGTEAKLALTEKQLEAAEAELNGVPEQLASGESQIKSGWEELRKQEKKLDQATADMIQGEIELANARQEYAEGKAEAEAEIADGEQKIADAEDEIADIETPKWYVYDRSTLVEFTGFGENAERLGAIGRVFPVLFFLVAALISLTSMTRMVEEQRTAIGTMKALGYGKMAIASKYLGYAFLATMGGSIMGVLIGEKILPYIIIYAYGILYQHITDILIPYSWGYGAMATGAAVACTMVATLAACYKELSAQPAILMRPPTPKNGQRVFLERVTFLWKHLSFTWKSSIRNLVRYKKRFFMTVFGIGGCMALMLVGFGLKDSCYEIAELQFADIQLYDGSIYLEEDITQDERDGLMKALKAKQDVRHYMEADMQGVTLVKGKKERATYECVFQDTENIGKYVSFHDRKSKEEYSLSDDGVIVSEKTAKLLDVKVGDTIEIKDEENGNPEVKIEHICENYMGHYIYFTPAYYEKVYGEAPEYNSILFAADDAVSQKQLESMGQEILNEDGALSVSYMRDIEKQLDDMLRSLNLVIVVLIISAGMLAFVVLYNLNTVNIAERKRELATLKVLGFYDLEVAEHVYRENMVLTLIGAIVGAVLGKFLHLFIIDTVEVDTAMFGRIINMPSYIYSFLFTVAFSLIVNAIMYFKLKKIDMVESLKSIE